MDDGFADAARQRVQTVRVSGRAIHPVGIDIEIVAARFDDVVATRRLGFPLHVTDAIEDRVLDGALRKERVGTHEGDAAAAHGHRNILEIGLAEGDPAAVRRQKASQNLENGFGAARGSAIEGHDVPDTHAERQIVEETRAVLVDHRHVVERHLTVDVRHRPVVVGRRQEFHAGIDRELLDHLGVFDLDVEPLLIPIDQVLHGRGKILVGRDHGDELADVEMPHNGQESSHHVEKEGRDLGQKVVQELDEELPLVEREADLEDRGKPARDFGPLVVRRIVGVDAGDIVDDLADAPRERPRGQLPLATEDQLLAPQPRDHHALDQEQADGDQPEREVLDQDEDDRGQDLATEEHRLNEGVADEAAERLHLVLDHRGDFGALDSTELRRREAQDTVDQLVAQLTEHALAEPALVEVDVIFEEAVDDDQEQEGGRQHDQRPDTIEVEPVHEFDETVRLDGTGHRNLDLEIMLGRRRLLEALGLDRPVDDIFGQIEHQEVERHRGQDDEQDPDLLLPGLVPDIAKEASLHTLRLSSPRGSFWASMLTP